MFLLYGRSHGGCTSSRKTTTGSEKSSKVDPSLSEDYGEPETWDLSRYLLPQLHYPRKIPTKTRAGSTVQPEYSHSLYTNYFPPSSNKTTLRPVCRFLAVFSFFRASTVYVNTRLEILLFIATSSYVLLFLTQGCCLSAHVELHTYPSPQKCRSSLKKKPWEAFSCLFAL